MIRSGEMNQVLVYSRSRTSPPLYALQEPEQLKDIHIPLLYDPDYRRILRSQSLTPNFDPYSVEPDTVLNDTKAYQTKLGIAVPISNIADLKSPRIMDFLKTMGIHPEHIARTEFRVKPNLRYGGYGHIHGPLNADFMRELEKGLQLFGTHYLQVEVLPTRIKNITNGELYRSIERLFFAVDGTIPEDVRFLGGFRDMLLEDSVEAQKNTIHGQDDARWGEIVAEE